MSNYSQINPTPSMEVDYDENITDLYKAITESNWDRAIQAVKKRPDEARTWVVRKHEDNPAKNMWRFLPIHSACARKPPPNLISALLNAYPEGARSIDDQGMYALHYATGNQATREVIRLLLMTYPDAAKMKDPRGMLPIHYIACWGPSSISVVDMILVANRYVGESQDEDGNTPLDLAKDGDYPERNAVVAALNRWMENSGGSQQSTTSQASSSTTPSHQVIGNKFKSLSIIDEKKSDDHDVISCISRISRTSHISPTSPTTASKMREMDDSISVMEIESKEDKLEISMLQYELKQRNEKIEKMQEDFTTTCNERDGLRQTLSDLTEQHASYKKKSETLSDRLGYMNASLLSMMQQQEIVLNATKAREEQWENLSKLRREKLKSLVYLEEQDASEEVELRNCLIKQNQEMAAMKATIATVQHQHTGFVA
jgi:hypothetical protein